MADLNAADVATIGTGALGVVQTIASMFAKSAAKKQQNKLFNQRTTFLTPDEAYKIVNATENRAQSGLDPATLQYLTGQTDQAFAASAGTAERLGVDPNDLSALFEAKVNQIMKIGSENHAANLENFSKYMGALGMLGENKTAEWVSKDNKLRDQLQAAGVNFANANTGLNSGLNTIIAAGAAFAQSQLYKDKQNKTTDTNAPGYATGTVDNAATAANRTVAAGGISPLGTITPNLPPASSFGAVGQNNSVTPWGTNLP